MEVDLLGMEMGIVIVTEWGRFLLVGRRIDCGFLFVDHTFLHCILFISMYSTGRALISHASTVSVPANLYLDLTRQHVDHDSRLAA